MYVRSLLLCLLFLSLGYSDDDCPASDKSKLASVRLRRHLLCEYDRNTRPVRNHKDVISLVLQLIVKYFEFDMHENSFTLDSWMALRWSDQHLVWNPADYDSIARIHMSISDIWTPDISVYNRRTQGGDPAAIDTATCIVNNQGQVTCVPSTSHTTICTSDLTKYPFDTHNCSVRFGSWVHSGEELDIQISASPISTEDLIPNSEWELVETQAVRHPGHYKCCPNNSYPSVYFSFQIRRIPGGHIASLILPAIALIVITLTSVWISPDNPHRLPLCFVNLICQFLYIQNTSWMVPMNGDKVPLILRFARDSLILSAFTILFSLLLKNMVEKEKSAPLWISKIVCILVAFKPGKFVFVGDSSFKGLAGEGDDDSTAIIDSQDTASRKSEWFLFAKILDRLCFFIFFIVYLCMFIAFTP